MDATGRQFMLAAALLVAGGRGKAHVTRHKVGPRNPDTKLGRGSGRAYITGKPVICLPRWRSPMPRSLPVPVRQAIWRRFQDGQAGPTIAAALGLAPRTVRKLLRRFRCGGQAAVQPSYDRWGATTPKLPEPIVQAALGLRREHPTWGSGPSRESPDPGPGLIAELVRPAGAF
jgi:hypothetical protein